MPRIIDGPVDPERPCRSVGPAGERCVRPRGHRESGDTRNPMKLHRDEAGVGWSYGVKKPAYYPRPEQTDGPHSEADYQSWMRV